MDESSLTIEAFTLQDARCPKCGRLLFKVKPGAVAMIEMKCEKCGELVVLAFSASALLVEPSVMNEANL